MRNNLPLIIGICLPIIFIIIISLVIFIPTLFIKPQYNFIYTTENKYYLYEYSYKNIYVLENNHIKIKVVTPKEGFTQSDYLPTLFLYDSKNNSSHQITLEEAQKYYIDSGPSSPDGYVINYQYRDGGIFEIFGTSDNKNGYYMSKGNNFKKLDGLTKNNCCNYGGFNLIGWIK